MFTIRTNSVLDHSKISSYAYSTARYIYFGWLRKMENQVELRERFDEVVCDCPSPVDEITVEQLQAEIQSMLGELSVERDREILKRHYLDEQDKSEVCEILCLSKQHCDRVLSRARKRLWLKFSGDSTYSAVGIL